MFANDQQNVNVFFRANIYDETRGETNQLPTAYTKKEVWPRETISKRCIYKTLRQLLHYS